MTIYGFTIINTEGFSNGKETETYLFTNVATRNEVMYIRYAMLFCNLILSQGMKEDEFGNTIALEGDFISSIDDDKCVGLIQMSDYHIQFEPFTKEI